MYCSSDNAEFPEDTEIKLKLKPKVGPIFVRVCEAPSHSRTKMSRLCIYCIQAFYTCGISGLFLI